MEIENIRPEDIERRSFEIIDSELKKRGLSIDKKHEHIIKRCIHTSADFDYAESLYFSEGVVERIAETIKKGCCIITDTKMAQAGINKTRLELFGSGTMCFISSDDVAKSAKERGLTRSFVAMEKALILEKPVIFVVGNAPTALFSIIKMYQEERFTPEAVIGAPVGFVNVEASKEKLIESGIPCIVNRGRKGGSNIAACIVNAIQYKM